MSVNQKTNNRQVEDALQVFTLVILEARLVTRDALRRITEYKVVINCPRTVFGITSLKCVLKFGDEGRRVDQPMSRLSEMCSDNCRVSASQSP